MTSLENWKYYSSITPYADDFSLEKVFRFQFDRLAVRCSLRRALPCSVMFCQRLPRRRTFFGDHAFEGREPMKIVSFSGVGIAGGLRLFDLLAKHRGPLVPGEQTFLMERQGHGERVRFPRRTKDRAIVVARYSGKRFGGAPGRCRCDE